MTKAKKELALAAALLLPMAGFWPGTASAAETEGTAQTSSATHEEATDDKGGQTETAHPHGRTEAGATPRNGVIIVTATRTRKPDLDIPAATTVIREREIRESGAETVADVLSQTNGFAYKALGAGGAAMGTMSNTLNVRGLTGGVLVLVNGDPIAWRGKYDLSQFPASTVERIEIVKGTGSVLYGSEAVAGVVNIITKRGADNQFHIGFGNYGQQSYGLSVGTDSFGVYADFSRFGNQDGVTTGYPMGSNPYYKTRTDIEDVDKFSAGINAKLSPNWSFMMNYYKTSSEYERTVHGITHPTRTLRDGMLYDERDYKTEQYISQLHYHDKLWRGSLYFNTGWTRTDGGNNITGHGARPSDTLYRSRERNTSYGLDIQRTWKLSPKATAIFGAAYEREVYHKLYAHSTSDAAKYGRNIWAAFGQWEQQLDAKNTLTIGARETWTTDANRDMNYSNFSATGQWLHKMDKENSLYLSIDQSFVMPTFAQMYRASGNALAAPDLKPQKGLNYEIGWKAHHGVHNYKAALFYLRVKNNITPHLINNDREYTYENEDFKNVGFEISDDIEGRKGLSFNWGLTYQNPQTKKSNKGYWDRTYGRLQLTGGVTYRRGKWTTALSGSVLTDRVQTPSSEHSFDEKPYFLTTWNTSYRPDDRSEFSLKIDNVLDRHDVISHNSTSRYYDAPFNFLVSYSYKF